MAAIPYRTLFVLEDLAQQNVAMEDLREGRLGLSGSETSWLLVLDSLARRRNEVGVWMRGAAELGTAASVFHAKEEALQWVSGGRVVLCRWQDDLVQEFREQRRRPPWIWTQLPLSRADFRLLVDGSVGAVIVVSDTVRLPFLHDPAADRIGRVHNPLNPFFGSRPDGSDGRGSRRVVFSGYVGRSKGVHRLLQLWGHLRRMVPDAVLSIAGSNRLYGSSRPTGRFGISDPEFETAYIAPLVDEFGGLEAAGIEFLGLQSPAELRTRYGESALGVVNPNWDEYTETFCCAAVEMLACGLPVFSVAAGALPETIGRSGGAVLAPRPDLGGSAEIIAALLDDHPRLQSMGEEGRAWVTRYYDLESLTDQWEQALTAPAERISDMSSPWVGPRGSRYRLERGTRLLGVGRCLRRLWDFGTEGA